MRNQICLFMDDETGATAVEYALIVTIMASTVIVGIGAAFGAVEWLFADNNSEINKVLK